MESIDFGTLFQGFGTMMASGAGATISCRAPLVHRDTQEA